MKLRDSVHSKTYKHACTLWYRRLLIVLLIDTLWRKLIFSPPTCLYHITAELFGWLILNASQARGRLFKCFQTHLVKLRLHPYLLQGPVLLFSKSFYARRSVVCQELNHLPYQLPWFPFPSQLNNSMRNNHEKWDQKCTINSSSYFYRIWFSLWLNNCLRRRMITWKQVTFVLRWKAVVVHEMREVAEHYIFNRSPENIFTLRFGSSGRVKKRQGKRQPRKQKHAIVKEQ